MPGERGTPGVSGPPGFCEYCNYPGGNYQQTASARSGGNIKGP